ncbi:MAG: flagellar motor protein MotB [Proteobacteria bacterium]|nr:flagellar motor protein MotB [Pseudomonadota bacterium]
MAVYSEAARKRVDNRKSNWLVTYADMVTLLLCFFVILLALAKMEEHRFKAISHAFKGIHLSGSPFMNEGSRSMVKLEEVATELRRSEIDAENDAIQLDDNGVTVSLSDVALFEPGSAKPTQDAIDMLDTFSKILYMIPNSVIIEGHTDDEPIQSERYPSNWELSAARAAAVARVLEGFGIKGKRIEIAAFGSHRPKTDNRSAHGRRINRRIDIVIKPF